MARPKRPKITMPTKEDIQNRKREGERYWGVLHGAMEIDDQYFNLRRPVGAPPEYKEDINYPPTGNSIVVTLADHVAGDSPQVRVPEANLGLKAQGRSERLEKGYQAALARFRAAQVVDPIRARGLP